MLDGHISTCFNKDTRDLFILCIVIVCQFSCIVLLLLFNLFGVVRLFIRLLFIFFVRLLFHSIILFDSTFIVHCSLEKYSILILDCIPGISIPTASKSESINIIHQTALFLS